MLAYSGDPNKQEREGGVKMEARVCTFAMVNSAGFRRLSSSVNRRNTNFRRLTAD